MNQFYLYDKGERGAYNWAHPRLFLACAGAVIESGGTFLIF
jgi:hypothetical protein